MIAVYTFFLNKTKQYKSMHTIEANYVDIVHQTIFEALVHFDTHIRSIEKKNAAENHLLPYLLPGFVDAHVHIESSMLVPSEFARLAVPHGTVATVSDPHEIANVCGMEGVSFMIDNGKTVPFSFNFGAPSCVPATIFETAGASLHSQEVQTLLENPDIKYLSEMMNFPGVLQGEPEVMRKIAAAKALGKPVDGHAPGLRGSDAKNYIDAGISTDHECFTIEEALEKLSYGMKIIIREGSAARNFEALYPLLKDFPDMIMFGSDDKHPDALVEGQIDVLCKRAVAHGMPIFNVLKAACINPVTHYSLDIGLLGLQQKADCILINNLQDFTVLATYIGGVKVAENGTCLFSAPMPANPVNQFDCQPITTADLVVSGSFPYSLPVIEAIDGELITQKSSLQPAYHNGCFVSDTSIDVLKIVVVNRYHSAPVAKAFIKNFGLTSGAIASSVAHDSHNIVAVGVDDSSLMNAINLIIQQRGGISLVHGDTHLVLPLPVAGLMSAADGYVVAAQYATLDQAAKAAGSKLRSPFMTLSFMALLVIPHVKLSDKGLFDATVWKIIG
jgi:adenine deaminase